MKGILEKRSSMHHQVAQHRRQADSLQAQLSRMEPLANLGLISAMIAHEMNNILTPLENYARLSLQHPEDIQLHRKTIEKTASNAERASRILQRMLTLANGRSGEPSWTPVHTMVEEVFVCLARDFSKDRITVQLDIADDLRVWGDAICLQQVLMNLILNAREAMLGKPGQLTIRAEETTDQTRIQVIDTGCGIPPENMDRIFDPFFTTKSPAQNSRSGTGLGLAFCRRIVEEHRGRIEVQSRIGQGSTFLLRLPRPRD
jgi:signal transduction histidine kinase